MAATVRRKPKGAYHHPDLEGALTAAAVRTIRERGVDALTLRDIGAQLGVSRTAIYRHFKDKSALLAQVALEGFRMFRHALTSAADEARARAADPIEEMGVAYVGFALENQSHYRTMFGDAFECAEEYPGLAAEGGAAFDVLLEAITEEQAVSGIGAGFDPLELAHIFWAGVHGIATLAMAGQLGPGGKGKPEQLCRLQARILRAGLRAGLNPAPGTASDAR